MRLDCTFSYHPSNSVVFGAIEWLNDPKKTFLVTIKYISKLDTKEKLFGMERRAAAFYLEFHPLSILGTRAE